MAVESRGLVKVEPSAKRVRAYLNGQAVVDTVHPMLVWETPYYPAYYFPQGDVRMDLLVPSDRTEHSPSRGDARYFDVMVGDRVADSGAWSYPDSPIDALRGLVRLDWESMDAWFEEDEEVYVHPRSPYTRVDILPSSRHVEVSIAGVTVADSHQPRILFETGLPPRYYLPLVDVRMDLLRPSSTTSRCPYKGTAGYWSVEVDGQLFEDIVWIYRTPLPESIKVAGLVSFYNERVDLRVDGVELERPRTQFSR
jgi:uncharacterized protein (DUF427 family)